ncbi:MAG: DUF1837 domain-containing protein [Pseudomonadota bacterium]|nr:DUF1837 domain-containing protein [Pseudomonadota bacterium]
MAARLPTPLLERIAECPGDPIAIALCPDFQRGQWRWKRLADHVMDWLPDVAFRPKERRVLLYEPRKQLAQACRRFFDVDDPEKRGEIGEVLLHAVCRQEFGTIPFIARLFYKMRTNDSVTSVDMAHLLYDEDGDDIELWLGEAKLYDDIDQAKFRAIQSIRALWDPDFLEEMKALVGPKVEKSAPYAERVRWLFADETSLDHLVDRLVIPICIAVTHPLTQAASRRTAEYVSDVYAELEKLREYLQNRVPQGVTIVCVFVPMDCKEKLENEVNRQVQSYL